MTGLSNSSFTKISLQFFFAPGRVMCWRKTPFEASGACHHLTVCYDHMKEGPEK